MTECPLIKLEDDSKLVGLVKMVKGRAAVQRDSSWRVGVTRNTWNSIWTNGIWDRLTLCLALGWGAALQRRARGPGEQQVESKPAMKANSTLGCVIRNTARRWGKWWPSPTQHSDHIWNTLLFHHRIVAPLCCRSFQKVSPPSRKEEGQRHPHTACTRGEGTPSKAREEGRCVLPAMGGEQHFPPVSRTIRELLPTMKEAHIMSPNPSLAFLVKASYPAGDTNSRGSDAGDRGPLYWQGNITLYYPRQGGQKYQTDAQYAASPGPG